MLKIKLLSTINKHCNRFIKNGLENSKKGFTLSKKKLSKIEVYNRAKGTFLKVILSYLITRYAYLTSSNQHL
jgi:hypothetical protein